MSKKILVGLMTLVLAIGLVGAGAFAVFSDVETSEDNTFTAGTLDLKVDGDDVIIPISESDLKPGWSKEYSWQLKNVGSIPGKVSVGFSAIDNQENGTNEPEDDAEAQPYADPVNGELGQYLKAVGRNGPKNQSYAHYAFTPNNGWTGPGRQECAGLCGLNRLGGHRYNLDYWDGVLGQDEYVTIRMTFSLDDDLKIKDIHSGEPDIDDNIIQSDSVEFDIIFHLEQAP